MLAEAAPVGVGTSPEALGTEVSKVAPLAGPLPAEAGAAELTGAVSAISNMVFFDVCIDLVKVW